MPSKARRGQGDVWAEVPHLTRHSRCRVIDAELFAAGVVTLQGRCVKQLF